MKQYILHLADQIDRAALDAKSIKQLSLQHDFDLNEAYLIQKNSVERRIQRGEIISGYKLGFTSKAKMKQMGVHELIWGRLTNVMAIENDGTLLLNKFIHPRVEPEIAFRVSKSIDQEITLENALSYFDAVAPAIEIIDSRYENFKFTLEDVIADNCSSTGYVIGEWHDNQTMTNNLGISLNINGIKRQEGNSNAILGNPIMSLVEMSKLALKYGLTVQAGDIVLAGAATAAEYVKTGDKVRAQFENLGHVLVQVI